MEIDKIETQVAAIKWYLEFGILSDPQVRNHIVLNIYTVDPSIKDTQLVIDQERKRMMVHVDFHFWSSLFKKTRILNDVHIILHEMLPDFKIRVVNNKDLLEKSLEIAKKI